MPIGQPDPILKSSRILIASQDRNFRDTLQTCFSTGGSRVYSTSDRTEAIDLCAKRQIDLMIVETELPVLNDCTMSERPGKSSKQDSISAIFIAEASTAGEKTLKDFLPSCNQPFIGRTFDVELVVKKAAQLLRYRLHHDNESSVDAHPAYCWAIAMQFDIETLQRINPVPIVVDALTDVLILQAQREIIFTIISELFTNALDHGLLKLDSTRKKTPEEFLHFYEQRQARLNGAKTGTIKLAIEYKPTHEAGQLVFELQDSGQGFDIDNTFSDLDNNDGFFGRGIKLVMKLCRDVQYSTKGNQVKATYEWKI